MSENDLSNLVLTGDQTKAVEILEKYRFEKAYNLGVEIGSTLINFFPRNFRLMLEYSCHLFGKGQNEECCQVLENLLTFSLKQDEYQVVLHNYKECLRKMVDKYNYYNEEKVKMLTERKPTIPLITLTITSCKRIDLFKQTINSLLNCCLDIDLVDRWFCVDDNSSEEDREEMKRLYPFIEFYFKSPQEKGHPRSMNIIREKVTTPYIFHLEDDWKFIAKRRYMSECLDVLGTNKAIGQCLINKNYSETLEDDIVGGLMKYTTSNLRYVLHQYCQNDSDYEAFYKTHGRKANCAYWKHFSFRPSLLRKSVLDLLGPYSESSDHFEAEYSERYYKAGFFSAFLDGIYSLHIGRLTKDRFDQTKANAYALNNEKQFGIVQTGIKSYVINLDRRYDRLQSLKSKKELDFLCYERFAAIDGRRLVPNPRLQHIFEGNDYNMRDGMVGCALSHLKLWVELVNSNTEAFCILEDDVDVVPDFQKKFLQVRRDLPSEWDICFLGHHLWPHHRTDQDYDKKMEPILEKWNRETSFKLSMGGTGGYLISRKGAERMLDFINKVGMTNGIDTMMQKACDELNVYYCRPHLIYSECSLPNTKVDSDIQYSFNSLNCDQTLPETIRDRLKTDGKFDVDSAILLKPRFLIGMSETTHNTEAIKAVGGINMDFPFDQTDGGTFDSFASIVEEVAIEQTNNFEQKLYTYVTDFCFNNKYGLTFPHDKLSREEMITKYIRLFKNLRFILKSNNEVIFIHTARWKRTSRERVEKFCQFLKEKTSVNFSLILVNGPKEKFQDRRIVTKELLFPEPFHHENWDQEKIYYDQSVFRVNLIPLIRQAVSEVDY